MKRALFFFHVGQIHQKMIPLLATNSLQQKKNNDSTNQVIRTIEIEQVSVILLNLKGWLLFIIATVGTKKYQIPALC